MKKLAIVIPVFNNWYYTKKTLQSLLKLDKETHKIIIVDNGSTDETNKLNSSEMIEVIRNTDNQGFGLACNQGFEFAKRLGYENVMFLNNDIKIDKDNCTNWTNKILEEVESTGNIVGPTIGCMDKNFNFVCEGVKIPQRGFWYMSGWCITAKTSVWDLLIEKDEIGPFRSLVYFAYFEDGHQSFLAKEKGIKFSIVDIPVKHIGRMTGKKIGLNHMYSASKTKFIKIWGNKVR